MRRVSVAAELLVGMCVAWEASCPCVAPAKDPPKTVVPLYEGHGTHGRKVTTESPAAQKFFDQGLRFLFAFNHDEAIRSFQQAIELDGQCGMAWWGIAFANGPHINNPVVDEPHAKAAWNALTKARELAGRSTPVERSLVDALGKRYADPQPADRKPLDEAFAAAMRDVWKQHPDDADVGALFAESLMDLRPWDLWTADGRPQPGTEEIVATLEKVLKGSPNHPLALHLYIHAVEASPAPWRAASAADRLRDLQPALGHMVHMPSHIDVRLGHWSKALEANERAILADRAYRTQVPQQNFYRVYMAHNHHMLAFAAMMQGQRQRATDAVRTMLAEIPDEWRQQNAAMIDGFYAQPVEVLVRFGRWDDVLREPEPPEGMPIARALREHARGVAFAARGDVSSARDALARFRDLAEKTPKDAVFSNNKAQVLYAVADALLEGEILYREGRMERSLGKLREALEHEDRLSYAEPPDWIVPVRHALGATLLHAGRAIEAEAVYREDLRRWPHNGWSLFGLAKCLKAQNKLADAAAADVAFRKAWSGADQEIESSCFCQPGR